MNDIVIFVVGLAVMMVVGMSAFAALIGSDRHDGSKR
jgi:hypothetical protein